MTHLDGSDVLVLDAQGRRLPSIVEVRIDYDRAVVATRDVYGCLRVLTLSRDDVPACEILSANDGRVHWRGPVRPACA